MSLRAGTLVDHRYELIERLGQGGQGSVWRAFDRNTGEHRALKIVHLPDGDGEAAERAHREAHLVKDARHPALVACHSLVEVPADGVLVLVFDFIQAMSLAESLRDERFGRAHRLAALRHIAGALAFLHRRGVVHRDLKPDNVLVTPLFWEDPAAPSGLKLIDFGIAAPRRGADGATLSGMFGTPPYMAPELLDAADLDAQRSAARDVFSFGVIGWELLDGGHPTGLPPRAGAGAYRASYVSFRRGREPWPPRPLEGRWGSVVAACLALDPQARPRDGEAILSRVNDGIETPLPGAATPSAPRSRAPLDHPQAVTQPHVAPGALVPERASAAPRPSPLQKGSTEPATPLPQAVERTQIAPPSSLPRSSAVERTTPMPAGIPTARESPDRGTWQALAIALVLVAGLVAGASWLVLGGVVSPAGSASTARPVVFLAPPVPASSTASAAESPTATESATAPASTTPPRVVVCCPSSKTECSSDRRCNLAPCKDREVPERRFALRVIGIQEERDIYSGKHDLAGSKELPASTVCVQVGEREACAPMKAIASKGGARLSHTVEDGPTDPLEVTTSQLRGAGRGAARLRLRIRNNGKWVHDTTMLPTGGLLTTALCGGLYLKDTTNRLFLSVYLDDPP